MKLLTAGTFYGIAGASLLLMAARIASRRDTPRRWGSALFWTLLGITFGAGGYLPSAAVGYLVLAMVLLAATGQVQRPPATRATDAERSAAAARLQNRIFWPALLIPATAIAGSLVLDRIHFGDCWLVDRSQTTLIALGLAAVVALVASLRVTRAPPIQAVDEGSRLLQSIGWALVLPQMLAALGAVFALAGVGDVVAGLVTQVLPTQFPVVAVIAYCLGMTLFTICLGNAFAAFAVITGGIGLPLIVVRHGGNPAIMAALGMLSGYCGTLLTPMAANFNLVPALLLDLRDRNAVIKAQVPPALAIFTVNLTLMYFCVFRF